jgi:hypothetical protein
MGIKSLAIKPFAALISSKVKKSKTLAVSDQKQIMKDLVGKAKSTIYGKDHGLDEIKTYKEFKNNVPISDYEGIKHYIEKVKKGEHNVLWPGLPKYFAKTSGTTSGVKYIPLTEDSLPNHINSARNALMNYVSKSNDAHVFDGKMIFLSGSPELNNTNIIPTGRLSGIVNLEIPAWVKGNQLPSYATNCIDDWETKLEAIIDETHNQDMRLISGIPPWVQMYYERLLSRTGKETVIEVFPNYSLFMYGGVNFEPYRSKLEMLVGRKIDSIETYPASEGFIAYQDEVKSEGLLLNTNSGIFFEFVPMEEIGSEKPERLQLQEVELDKDYAIIINNNAGLWGYNIGDMVRFISLDPYRLIVSGRVKHYISAFGEHVIGKEVEFALLQVSMKHGVRVVEFTVAPQVNPLDLKEPYHEWFIEFDIAPEKADIFTRELDSAMCAQNIYYKDLIEGKILRSLRICSLPNGAFRKYMKSEGKLGGQNKVPRLSNDRKLANKLLKAIS